MRFITQIVSGPVRRFAFIRPAGQYIIVDVSASGSEEWASQFSGESRWYPFEPSPDERATFARSWLESEEVRGGRHV